MEEKNYSSPRVELIEVEVEIGFALSTQSGEVINMYDGGTLGSGGY